jgi:hypothetical protein
MVTHFEPPFSVGGPRKCLARALGAAVVELLPSEGPAEPLPVLREQAERLFGALLEKGDRETFLRLNPLLALLVEAAAKRR